MDNFIVTIARGYGSGGKEIGNKIAEAYGIQCYERRILTLASQLSGIDESEFKKIDEKLRAKNWRTVLNKLPMVTSSEAMLQKFVSDDLLFEYQAKIIRTLQETESCVIVGKAADYVLRDCPNVLSVYIEAPRDYTRRRIMEKQCVPPDIADNMITRTDRYRADYYEQYTHGNYWTNPVNYDITLNSARLGIEGCVNMIEQCLKEKLGIKLPEKAG
ncbi:MAG: cytidylate kinase-like family protein [Lachnobacterium sp.]|nr:cytidylate kinase-like family protein [Lachnobacterium sp.]MDD6633559.1 cytidylate kinase-like family protein [Lachnobacterium sp.]MDY2911269.1 cytidylate kinase-like family protein [Agathobacter sp.]